MLLACRVSILLGFGLAVAVSARCESPTLLQQLMTVGVQLPNDHAILLEPPSLNVATDAESRQAKLDEIAGGIGWQRFSRDSVVAPIEIEMGYIKDDAGNRIGHRIYVAFIVHASIDKLRDRDQVQAIFGSPQDQSDTDAYPSKKITEDELVTWGVTDADDSTSYSAIRMPLLDRVLVQGIIKVQQTGDEDGVAASWLLDPRFTVDASSRPANRWSQLAADPTEWHPYEGAGGYMHMTQLSEPDGACLIETRMVLHEPTAWFRGSNLLRSKLPLMIQESVRKFRRQLSEPSSTN